MAVVAAQQKLEQLSALEWRSRCGGGPPVGSEQRSVRRPAGCEWLRTAAISSRLSRSKHAGIRGFRRSRRPVARPGFGADPRNGIRPALVRRGLSARSCRHHHSHGRGVACCRSLRSRRAPGRRPPPDHSHQDRAMKGKNRLREGLHTSRSARRLSDLARRHCCCLSVGGRRADGLAVCVSTRRSSAARSRECRPGHAPAERGGGGADEWPGPRQSDPGHPAGPAAASRQTRRARLQRVQDRCFHGDPRRRRKRARGAPHARCFGSRARSSCRLAVAH